MDGRGRGGGGGGRKVLLPPINFIFKLLQQRSTVQIWLYEQLGIRIEGNLRVSVRQVSPLSNVLTCIVQGFDEFMNLVIDDAIEIKLPGKTQPEEERRYIGESRHCVSARKTTVLIRGVGQILLKGDNVSLIQAAQS